MKSYRNPSKSLSIEFLLKIHRFFLENISISFERQVLSSSNMSPLQLTHWWCQQKVIQRNPGGRLRMRIRATRWGWPPCPNISTAPRPTPGRAPRWWTPEWFWFLVPLTTHTRLSPNDLSITSATRGGRLPPTGVDILIGRTPLKKKH